MKNVVRAWKDEAYRQGLSAEEQALLPANPVGEIELTDADLEAVYGAWGISQGVHQHAVATYGSGNVISGSVVRSVAQNSYKANNATNTNMSSVHSC